MTLPFSRDENPLTFDDACAREAIAFPENIQSFGFMLVVDSDWHIERASANLAAFLGIDAAQAIGRPLERVIAQAAMHHLATRLTELDEHGGVERMYGIRLTADRQLYDLAVHLVGHRLVIEGERCGQDQPVSAATLVRSMMAQLQAQPTMATFYEDAAKQVRALTGFDRTLIYRFDEDGSGQVIAESLGPSAAALLGLHYPASDIPEQARALYLRNPFRIIADVGSTTVMLVSAATDAGMPVQDKVDLSLAITRAVSPVHIAYLRNMSVGASLSISIIIDGTLWGLIVCHHRDARLPSFVMRSAAELFGAMVSLTLESRLHAAAKVEDERARMGTAKMLCAILEDPTRLLDPAWLLSHLAGLIPCDGVVVSHRGNLLEAGDTPELLDVGVLIGMFDAGMPHSIVSTNYLTGLVGKAKAYAGRASGVLAIPISRIPCDYLLLFRREKIEETSWAGDPETRHIDGVDVTPRASFQPFARLSRHRSLPFVDRDRRNAEAIRIALNEVVLRLTQQTVRERRHIAVRQELMIAELNHRVRNILALIQGLIGQSATEGIGTLEYVTALGGRVQALARAHDHANRVGASGLLSALLEDEVAAFAPVQRERLQIRGSPLLLRSSAFSTLALVLHELVTNSVKYGALSTTGRIILTVRRSTAGVMLEWRERGGPPIAPPTRRGFGSVVIERMVPFDLKGTVRTRYPVDGFEADIFVPEINLADEREAFVVTANDAATMAADHATRAPAAAPLQGKSVLICEDSMMVALEAESFLTRLGAAQVWIAADIAEAQSAIAIAHFDVVMLDVAIGDGMSLAFARTLRVAGIPFFFASGYDVRGDRAFADCVTVQKPYGIDDLDRAIARVLASGPIADPIGPTTP